MKEVTSNLKDVSYIKRNVPSKCQIGALKCIFVTTIMVLGSLGLLGVVSAQADQNWVVRGDVIVQDEELEYEGNVEIKEGASLTLINVSLTCGGNFEIKQDGRFSALNGCVFDVGGNFEGKESAVIDISKDCKLDVAGNVEFKHDSTVTIKDNCELTGRSKLELKENVRFNAESTVLNFADKLELKHNAHFAAADGSSLSFGGKIEAKEEVNIEITDSILELAGDFELKPKSHVVLRDSILRMVSEVDGEFGILVKENAQLDIYNSVITAKAPSHYYWFDVYGGMNLINSCVYYTAGSINIYSSDVVIDGSTVSNSQKVGLAIVDSSPTITNSLIKNNTVGIDITGEKSAPVISNSIIQNNEIGINSTDSTPIITNNTIA
jgi:hypothetical protein